MGLVSAQTEHGDWFRLQRPDMPHQDLPAPPTVLRTVSDRSQATHPVASNPRTLNPRGILHLQSISISLRLRVRLNISQLA